MLSLTAEKRDVFGKDLTKARQAGKLPVVVYGHNQESKSFFVDSKLFKKVWGEAGESTIISLNTPEGDKEVLIHDTAFHPVSGDPLHVDFLAIDTKKPIQVKIPLEYVGVSDAIKSMGAILVKVMHEIEIEVLPKELPKSLIVDISKLSSVDSHISVKDILLPPSAKALARPEDIVASASMPKEEKEEVEPVDLSKIEVEKKGKEETEGAEAATPKA